MTVEGSAGRANARASPPKQCLTPASGLNPRDTVPTAPGVLASSSRPRHHRVHSLLDEGLRLFPGHLRLLLTRASVHNVRGDYAAAEALADTIIRRYGGGPGPVSAEMLRGSVDGTRGRITEAAEHLRSAAELARRSGLHQFMVSAELLRAGMPLLAAGDTAATLRRLESALAGLPTERMAPDEPARAEFAYRFARAGRPDRAEALLEENRRAYEEAGVRYPDALAGRARAAIAFARCDLEMAMDELRVIERKDPCFACVAVEQGQYLGFTLERLAQLYEEAGDAAQAVEHYARLVELWKDADPILQSRVNAARLALSRLTSER